MKTMQLTYRFQFFEPNRFTWTVLPIEALTQKDTTRVCRMNTNIQEINNLNSTWYCQTSLCIIYAVLATCQYKQHAERLVYSHSKSVFYQGLHVSAITSSEIQCDCKQPVLNWLDKSRSNSPNSKPIDFFTFLHVCWFCINIK